MLKISIVTVNVMEEEAQYETTIVVFFSIEHCLIYDDRTDIPKLQNKSAEFIKK